MFLPLQKVDNQHQPSYPLQVKVCKLQIVINYFFFKEF